MKEPRECARKACKSKRAKYFNSSTRQYYCGGCAAKINYWSQRDHGITLCKIPEENDGSH